MSPEADPEQQAPANAADEPFVSTSVVADRGQWTVVLDVVFADGAVRHVVQTYRTKAKAEQAADIMRRTAERQPRPDWGMT